MSEGYVLAVIPARGGSKGVPRKNIRLLAGKPLIAYAVETARSCSLIDRVIVSTDDVEIAKVAQEYGAEIPFLRPAELAQDDTPEWLVWQHAIRTLSGEAGQLPIETFVCLSPTSPLRAVVDVEACLHALRESEADLTFAVKPAERNPYFNMVLLDESGYARLVIPPSQAVYRRQAAPVVYDMTTVVYAARPQFILNATSMFSGKVKAITIPPERAVDIDTELDFRIAEFIMSERSKIL
jgi:N-acylneuraminate cytidylyltransferase